MFKNWNLRDKGSLEGICSFVLIALFSASVTAAPIDNGYFTTSGGLDWLDLTETRQMSFVEVSGHLNDASSALYGWRYATGQEFDLLMQDFGFVSTSSCSNGMTFCDSYAEGSPSLSTAIAMLGDTHVAYLNANGISTSLVSGQGSSWGILADAHGPNHQHGGFLSESVNGNNSLNYIHTYWGHININYTRHVSQGSFLVRDSQVSVSEPQTLTLAILGMIMVRLSRRPLKASN